jgi:aryl-alcohol dehydrogenase-like predicted oxidoreductase
VVSDSIQIKRLGTIPPLGLGTWQWGDRLVWGFGKGYQQEDLQAVYQAALRGGVRLVDTAEFYGFGLAEKLIGQYYQLHEPRPLVVSKMFPYPWRFSRKALLAALKQSLKRLQMSQVDLYMLHWPWRPVPLEQWAESLAQAHEQGLTRAVGVANHSLPQLERVAKVLAKHKVTLAANQIEYHLLERGPEQTGLLRAMQAEGVALMAYSPLAMGWLTGKYSPDNPPPGRYRARRYVAKKDRIPGLLKALSQIAQSLHATTAQVALRWCIQKGALPIPGAKNAQQAESNAGALEIRLSDEEMSLLNSTT